MNSLRNSIRNDQYAVEQSAHVTKGHSAKHPGLRGHSVGDIYPWAIVTYEDNGVKSFAAENLLSGTKLTPMGSHESAEDMLAYHLRRCEEDARAVQLRRCFAAKLLAETSAVTEDTVKRLSLLGIPHATPDPKLQRKPHEVCALLTARQSNRE